MDKVLGIYGAGGLGREVLELAKLVNAKEARWKRLIFVVDAPTEDFVNGTEVYAYEDAKEKYGADLEISLGIGEPLSRNKVFHKLIGDGIQLATLIHPDVHIPDTTIVGNGVTIQYGCFVSCNVKIEDGVYIQPQANIGHDDILGNGCVISGFANLAGHVSVGTYSYIGISACVMENVSIGDWSIVGMASAVYKDIPDGVVALGNPARPMKKNDEKHVFK